MPADSGQLIHLKEIRQTFSQSTRLHVNFHKPHLYLSILTMAELINWLIVLDAK
jgi:hypothetical protein